MTCVISYTRYNDHIYSYCNIYTNIKINEKNLWMLFPHGIFLKICLKYMSIRILEIFVKA